MSLKLNLGCGPKILDGFINCDIASSDERVIKIDLNKLPLKWETDTVDFILMEHCFEHLDVNHVDFMRECWRILVPSGKIKIVVPCCMNIVSHKKTVFTPNYFNPLFINHKETYLDFCYEIISFKHINYHGLLNDFIEKFPSLRNMFPYLINGEYEWLMKTHKIVAGVPAKIIKKIN